MFRPTILFVWHYPTDPILGADLDIFIFYFHVKMTKNSETEAVFFHVLVVSSTFGLF